jgi:histidine phosphotransferase ChpT
MIDGAIAGAVAGGAARGRETMVVDLKVAQLLCSRMCHDLVGPVGAVNAGLELLTEASVGSIEALDLALDSGAQVTRRLEFYRMAFGFGGAEGVMRLDRSHDLAAGLLAGGGVALDWDTAPPWAERDVASASARLVLNLVLLGVEALPRGGSLTVRFAQLDEGVCVAVTAAGRGACLRDEVRAALQADASAADLSVRSVQAFFAQRLAAARGSAIEVSAGVADQLRLAFVLDPGDAA